MKKIVLVIIFVILSTLIFCYSTDKMIIRIENPTSELLTTLKQQ